MEKKEYMIPGISVMTVDIEKIMVISGGGDKEGDPQIDPNADDSDDPNRSRRTYDVWEEEEVEE